MSRSPRSLPDRAPFSTTAIASWGVVSSSVLRDLAPRCPSWLPDLAEAGLLVDSLVRDGVLLPVLVVEVPPLERIHDESFLFEHATQQGTVETLKCSAAGVVRARACRRFVVCARHLHRASSLEIEECNVHSGSAIVLRALGRIRDQPMQAVRG